MTMPLSQVEGVREMHEHRERAMQKLTTDGCCGEAEYLTHSTGRCVLCGWCPKRLKEMEVEKAATRDVKAYAGGWESEASFPKNGTPTTREVA